MQMSIPNARQSLTPISSLLPSKLSRTLRPFDLWTLRREPGFLTVEEVLAPNATSVAHASEYAALIVEIYGRV